jgi:hypothetical protein
MRELTIPSVERASRALSARTARLAVRVAELLDDSCSEQSGAAEAARFLRTWSTSVTAAAGQPAARQPIDLLARRYGLDDCETTVLLLAGLPEEHEGLASTLRQVHPNGEPRPTVGLAALVLGAVADDRSTIRRMLWDGPLVRHGLVQLAGSGALFEQSLVLADRLWDALHGHDAWPASIHRVRVPDVPPGLDRWLAGTGAQRAVHTVAAGAATTMLVTCPDQTTALGRCATVVAALGIPSVAGRIRGDDDGAFDLLAIHAAARGAVPIAVLDPIAPDAPLAALADEHIPGPVMVCATPGTVRPGPNRPVVSVPIGPIGPPDHRAAWQAALPHLAAQAPTLAARHPLDPAFTAQVATDVRGHERLAAGSVDIADISGLIRARIGISLPAGIDLTTPHVDWHRLVMPDEPGWQLRDAVARLEHQATVLDDWGFREQARASRGARLLFTGPPGTGKSLAAEAVATAAGTDLLTVDVSRIVSKWIGETEKNLSAAFDAAERTQAVLLLDEADALFGARTEITDAHDRYANLETAYLLQRLDHFDGLAVLATNLRHNIDPAFVRRMDFVVEFPLPDLSARRELWPLHLPTDVLADDVDVETLARMYPVPGGWIRNAAIAAAFRAAAAGDRIGQHHLVAAMRREYAKAALPFPGEPPRRRRHDTV